MSRDHGLTVAFAVRSSQFTFERQEELPAVSDEKQHGSTKPAMNMQFALFHEKLHDKFFFYALSMLST